MTLTKERIVDSIHDKYGFSREKSTKLVGSVLEIMKSRLESGEDVVISGFGKFSVKEKNERRGRNPATGRVLMLGARRVVTFKCSPVLRDRINRERRIHHRVNKQLRFELKTEDFDIVTETINLSCAGAYCQVNKRIPLMTTLKIVLALPYEDEDNGLEYVECNGVVVRAEKASSKAKGYNTAIYFTNIDVDRKERIANFVKKVRRKEIETGA